LSYSHHPRARENNRVDPDANWIFAAGEFPDDQATVSAQATGSENRTDVLNVESDEGSRFKPTKQHEKLYFP
jgi:hypothetical protein